MNILKKKIKLEKEETKKKLPKEFLLLLIGIIVFLVLAIALPSAWSLFKLHKEDIINKQLNLIGNVVASNSAPNSELEQYKAELINLTNSNWILPNQKEEAMKLSAIATLDMDLNVLNAKSKELSNELNQVLPTMNKTEIYNTLNKVWSFVSGADFKKAELDSNLCKTFGYWGPDKQQLINSYAQPLFNLINKNSIANPQ